MKKESTDMNHATSKKRILIVEDDPAVMKIFSTVLTHNGYEVTTATNALPALFRVTQHPPDLILADLKMPAMDGLEMIGQFKAHVDTRDIPIVVVTGSASEETRAAAFKAGCAGFLSKPVNPVDLLAQVAGLLTHEKTHA